MESDMTSPSALTLLGFANPSGKSPSFLLPVFGNATETWIQDSNGNGLISRFVPCQAPLDNISRNADPNIALKVGDAVLYAFQFANGKVEFGPKALIQKLLQETESSLREFPFVTIDVLSFLNDTDALPEAIAVASQVMAKTNPDVASEWAALTATPLKGPDLFLVDNSENEWNVLRYLREWTSISSSLDIATGCFEIGSLLALDRFWQKLQKIRILMGDDVTARTRKAFIDALKQQIKNQLDCSLEQEKDKNDFLKGVPGIVDAMQKGIIQCRVYTKRKFHAKAFITHPKVKSIGQVALTGSSNFTVPGITENVELNVQNRAPDNVAELHYWFAKHWDEAEDITPDLVTVVERHTREYTPFEIYAKALDELFRRHELTASEWEKTQSRIHPILDQYQRDGYTSLYHTAANYNGAFLCDGVGLGKTFIGLMLIERLVMYEKKRVVLFVPKSGRVPVWERNIKRYLPHLLNGFLSFKIFNHTDLMRGVSADGTDFPSIFEQIKDQADVIVIDEAHHFRNRGLGRESGGSRYWKLYDLCEGKQVFHLTATPVNNALTDFQHLIEIFSRQKPDAFATRLGIHNLAAHFRQLEKQLAGVVNAQALGELFVAANTVEAGQVLFSDRLFRELVVQRSRAYVIQSQKQQGSTEALFPIKEPPRVANYSVKATYGHLLGKVEIAFAKEKPLFALAPYHPLDYPVGAVDEKGNFEIGRQRGLVRLIRVQFLKRFESSITAFEQSCQNLLLKFLAFLEVNSQSNREKERLEKWRTRNKELLTHIHARRQALAEEEGSEETEETLGDEFLDHFEPLDRKTYRVDEIFDDTFDDLQTLLDFLEELKQFTPAHDDKLKALVKLLKSNADLKDRKVLIFTEFMATARYLKQELQVAGIEGVDEVDSATKQDRTVVLQRFAPYYNDSSSADLAARGLKETQILLATDVLSEGLNLQDATRMINYDLHWNPVRLMQRIGRVDRRLSSEVEKNIVTDHPEEKSHRGKVVYWNFLPPDELDDLLKLYSRVAQKTLRISKVFGIEGKKLLKPDDDFDALRDFLSNYEGVTTPTEKMQLELERLLAEDPKLEAHLDTLPGRVFSGKAHHQTGAQAVFFCYNLPAEDVTTHEWTDAAGRTAWYLFDFTKLKILEHPEEIHAFIKCQPDTPRRVEMTADALRTVRLKIETHIKNTYMKQMQAPVGVKPSLKCWMELN
jgi:superfamily II DNA or RNA helicase